MPVEIKLLFPRSRNPYATEEFDSRAPAMSETGGMVMGSERGEDKFLPAVVSLEEERRLQMNYIESQLKSIDMGWPIAGGYVERRLMAEALLVRKRIEDEGQNDALLERYRRAVGALVRIIRGIRLELSLKTQQSADQMEAWLVREVMSSGAKERLGPDVWAASVAQLSDKAGRKNGRYLALCCDLFMSVQQVPRRYANDFNTTVALQEALRGPAIGRYSIPTIMSGSRLIAQRQMMVVAWHMKQLLEASDEVSMKNARERVARDWATSPSQLGLTSTPFDSVQTFSIPCSYWFGEWERQADALRE